MQQRIVELPHHRIGFALERKKRGQIGAYPEGCTVVGQRSLGFAQDTAVSGPVITVTDKESGKVVRQIPVEAVVRVAHSIEKMKGLLFDKVL